MSTYSYQGIDANGHRVSGEIVATDPDAVVAQLTARGLRIEAVRTLPSNLPAGETAGAVTTGTESTGTESTDRAGQLTAADTREIGGHISEIISAGVPLESGLAAIAAEFPRTSVSRALRRIVAELETGKDLEEVLADCQSVDYLPALIRAGQRSGRTAEILDNFISGSQASADLRQTWWMAMAYPVLLLSALLPLFCILVFRILPQFDDLFKGFELKLNMATMWLLAVGEFLRNQSVTIFLAVVVSGAIVAIVFFTVFSRTLRRQLLCSLPLIGRIFRWSAFARFSPLLSALIDARVPLPTALILAGDAAGDAVIQADCRELAAELSAGSSLKAAADKCRRFPPSFRQALCWKDQRENFPEILRSMADLYAGRVRALLMLLAAILPPLLVILVAVTVGTIVILLFFPLIQLMNALS